MEDDDDDHHNPRGRSTASVNLSKLIDVELNLLEKTLAMHEVEQVIIQIKEARDELEKLQGGERIDIMMELQELKKAVGKLKSKVPFNLVTPDDEPNPDVNRHPRSNRHKGQSQPTKEEDLEDDEHPTSEDLISFLDNDCLLAESLLLRIFMLFPGKAILKLSLLACWEDVHGLGEPKDKPELHVLVSKGIIKPVFKTSSRTVSGFRMHPFVRSTLSAAFSKTLYSPQEWKYHYLVNSIEDEEEDVFYDDPLEFSTMKHLKFLHLGKWQKSSAQHIEMEDPELYFKNIKRIMYDLRYISFRGISMIKELPRVLNRLPNLNFLELRACYHLEAIPSDIGQIWKCLTHLDMSECYFLDHMPASLSRLHHLCVLKGFYVGETSNNKKPCTLQDLSSLRHLWKLNIYTSVKGFPNEDQLTALHGFVSLRRLTVSWGGCSARREECKSTSPDLMALKEFSFQLEKLDLQCVPNTVTRHWLKPSNFQMLKKLYIRGGEFNDLGWGVLQKGKGLEEEDESWNVEILRLKHLSEMQMDCSRLVHLFPKLVSLEKVECPHLTGFPCDKSGLWMKTTQKPPPIPIPTYTHGRKFYHRAWRRVFKFPCIAAYRLFDPYI